MNIDAINQILVLFIVIFVGYYIRKIELVDDYVSKKFASLVIYIAMPALIVNSMISEEIDVDYAIIMQLVLITVVIYAFLFVMTLVIPKILNVPKGKIGIYKFMVFFSNVGFVAFPILYTLYGDVAIFYASILNLPFNFFLFTLGVYFVSMDHHTEHKFELKKFFSPALIASIIGLFLFITKLPVPELIKGSLSVLGSLTTPLSMLIIGGSLIHTSLIKVISDWRLIVLCVLKQLVFPVIVYGVLTGFGFDGLMLTVPTLLMAMPIASNAVIICLEYGGNNVAASEGVFLSTLSSIVSLTVVISFVV